jgi:serine/threonine protein kinase
MQSNEIRAQEGSTPSSAKGPTPLSALADEDPRIVDALERYLAAVEAGEKPNRQAFLARHADIAGALAECLDGLDALQAASSSGTPSPVLPNADSAAADLHPEAPLGDFRIVREIGRGGMGIVYEAVQMSLGRRVALKVLPFAAAMDLKQLQRFKNEAQAAAHLHHTNIVPVYAVGAERGVHFYAMQLIEGHNLAAVIADLRGRVAPASKGVLSTPSAEPTGPYPAPSHPVAMRSTATRSNLGAQLSTHRSDGSPEFFRTVVRLVAQVAEALDYAHGMGIVHRDIKPANLLVDAHGTVWITDFGLAHFHTNASLTQTGDLVGTLRYMSPEQAGGPRTLIDHRTDVYSLGATLYELLTLQPIFEGTDRNTLLHQILHEEPRPPRSVDHSIPPELETIVLKAASKIPAERYATARDFAEDLQRFLRNEPILARRATPIQRARKWLRRHPSVLTTAVIMLVLLAAGSLFSAWLIQQEREKAVQRAQRAEEGFQRAKNSVNEIIRISEEELPDRPDMKVVRRLLLESVLDYYQHFIDERIDDPEALKQLTETQTRVKKILDDLTALEGGELFFMLQSDDVLKDLQTSPRQRIKLRELWQQLDEQRGPEFLSLRRSNPKEWKTNLVSLARRASTEANAILTEAQQQRLKQITLRHQGPAAFRQPEIVEKLGLTPEQRERIRVILARVFSRMPDGMGPMGPPPGPPGFGKLEHKHFQGPPLDKPPGHHDDDLEDATKQIEAQLTPAQLEQWRELTGKPFDGFFCPRPGLGGPGGGPRGVPHYHFESISEPR